MNARVSESTVRYQSLSGESDLIIAKEIATAGRAYYGPSGLEQATEVFCSFILRGRAVW